VKIGAPLYPNLYSDYSPGGQNISSSDHDEASSTHSDTSSDDDADFDIIGPGDDIEAEPRLGTIKARKTRE
jgi:hypothetical protein